MTEIVHQPQAHPQPNYLLVFLILAVVTAIELGVSFVSHMERSLQVSTLVLLAVAKALLVAMYYMHLKFEPRTLRLVAIIPLFFAFLIVFVLIL